MKGERSQAKNKEVSRYEQKLFKTMISNASLMDIKRLTTPIKDAKVYNFHAKSIENIKAPWPVALLMEKYNKKFIRWIYLLSVSRWRYNVLFSNKLYYCRGKYYVGSNFQVAR